MFSRLSVCTGPRRFPSALLAAIAVRTVTLLLAVAPVSAQGQAAAPAKHADRLGRLKLSKFYDTPSPLPAGKPGELIRSEPSEAYSLAADLAVIRIVYHSRSASGGDVATSGVVLVPDGT